MSNSNERALACAVAVKPQRSGTQILARQIGVMGGQALASHVAR